MKRSLIFAVLYLLSFYVSGQPSDTTDLSAAVTLKRNYLGFTPTFILMGMYGCVYSRAIDEKHIITPIIGYTNFDLSPVPFLSNDEWKYQNIYTGINYTLFPFSKKMFPRGFYYGFDFVPSVGFWESRQMKEKSTGLSVSADILAGYSWIFWNTLKLSADLFLNVNTPGIKLSGEDGPAGKWVILPFFDINLGIIF